MVVPRTSASNLQPAGPVPSECASCPGLRRGLCAALGDGELRELYRHSRRISLRGGAPLVCQGHEPQHFNMLRGVAKISKVLEDGRHQIVGLEYAPSFVGWPWRGESPVSVEAALPVDICAFSPGAVARLEQGSHNLTKWLLERSSREVDRSHRMIAILGRRSAVERLAFFIADTAGQVGVDQTGAFNLPLSRAEIADFLGLTVETVSRQLTKLRGQRIISVEDRKVRILNPGRLADIVRE